MSDKAKADQLYEEAKGCSVNSGFFSKLFGFSDKTDEASDKYRKAGSHYKIAKCWNDAAKCYLKAANISEHKGYDRFSAASDYVEAGNCFRKFDPKEAVNAYQNSVDIYLDSGKHALAAHRVALIGEIYEKELNDIKKSMEAYEKAADLYHSEESKANANKNLLKVADLAATEGEYKKAIDLYERVAAYYSDNPLTKYSLKDNYFKASLVYLCYDILEGKMEVEKYAQQCQYFRDSREFTLVREIIRSAEECDLSIFEDAVSKHHAISRIDDWTMTLIERIKKPLEGFIDVT